MADPSRDIPGVITFPPLIYLVAILTGLALEWLWPLALLPSSLQYGLGGLLIAAAVALIVWALPQFHRLGTNVSVHQPATAIITSGPYRFTRNPLYIALALFQAGLGIAADALWVVVLLAPALLAIRQGVIAREERYLENKFGRAYLDYKATVRRWL